MRARDVEARFKALDTFLIEHQGLWRPRPFTHRQLPWEAEHPALSQWLRQQPLADAETALAIPMTCPPRTFSPPTGQPGVGARSCG